MRLADTSLSFVPPPADEPVFQISEVVEPSLSDATSREPYFDNKLSLVVREVPGPSRRATGSEDAVPNGERAFDDPTSEIPRMVVSSPRHQEDVTWACFNAPNEATPLNPFWLVGDFRVSVQEMARYCFVKNLVRGPFHIVQECWGF